MYCTKEVINCITNGISTCSTRLRCLEIFYVNDVDQKFILQVVCIHCVIAAIHRFLTPCDSWLTYVRLLPGVAEHVSPLLWVAQSFPQTWHRLWEYKSTFIDPRTWLQGSPSSVISLALIDSRTTWCSRHKECTVSVLLKWQKIGPPPGWGSGRFYSVVHYFFYHVTL